MSALSEDGGVFDPPCKQRECCEPFESLLLGQLMLLIRQMTDGISDSFEASRTEIHCPLAHRLARLIIFDLRESKTRTIGVRIFITERLPHQFGFRQVSATELGLQHRIDGLSRSEYSLISMPGCPLSRRRRPHELVKFAG